MPSLSLSPRWLSHLTTILAENKKAVNYALATVEIEGGIPVPRVRHMLHRDILTSHPTRPLLIGTTDIRSTKVHQILSHPDTKGPTSEIAWWIAAVSVQFRISVRIHLLPVPSHELHSQFPLQLLSSAGGGDAGPNSPDTPADWEALRVKMFNSLPPFLRASFARPPPGSPLKNPKDAKSWPTELPEIGKESSEEEKKHVKEALANFALVLLEPSAVEFLELGVVPNRRTQWKLSGGEWVESIV
ncbi:hypothetical protein BDV93DRAFT_525126, partial [Ceratobasidium sp. AG-I]